MSYQTMVDYVGRVTDPLEEHMAAHDTWHRDRLAAEQLAGRANRLAMWALFVAAGTGISGLVTAILVHR